MMNRNIASKRSDVIAEEAAEYFVALQAPNAKTRAEFIDWLKLSPEHVNEFLAVAALWDSMPEVSAQPSPEELIQLAAGEQNVVALGKLARDPLADSPNALPNSCERGGQPQAQRPRRRGRARWLGFVAAAAVVAVSIDSLMPHIQSWLDPNLYRTAIGEQTSVSLEDGSIVTLNTLSTLRVDYSEGSRVVHLTEGEALFEVARDPARPFRVITDSVVIEAVGTQFNVRSVTEDVTVTVIEGIVDVSTKPSYPIPAAQPGRLPDTGETARATGAIEPVRLTVGQQARIESRSGQVAVIEAPRVEKAVAWQQRRLLFERLSLKEVIDEFNRYNYPPILIDDPDLQNLPISGVFRSNDRDSFVQFLTRMKLAESHTRRDGTIVLRSMQEH